MHIIYLGAVTSKKEIGKLYGGSEAGNKMQLNILKELKKYPDVTLDIYSILPIAAFPKDRKLYVKRERKKIDTDIYITQIPFVNLPIIKQWMQSYELFKNAKKNIKKNSIALSFNLYMQEGNALIKLKKRYGITIASILADLPIDDNYSRKGISSILYNYFFERSKKNILECENLIVLNEYAVKKYAPQANYIVVEGGIEYDKNIQLEKVLIEHKNIVYSGALTDYSGVREIMLAMEKVENTDIELDIYGDGPLKEWIIEYVKIHNNISYNGKVLNDQMIKIQKRAWLLVNPRPVEDRIAQVTFPSKIFEYMTSGRPVLSTDLTGLSSGYKANLFISKNNSPDELAQWINRIDKMKAEDLSAKGSKAFEYIVSNKTWDKQTNRIYNFLRSIEIKGYDK